MTLESGSGVLSVVLAENRLVLQGPAGTFSLVRAELFGNRLTRINRHPARGAGPSKAGVNPAF